MKKVLLVLIIITLSFISGWYINGKLIKGDKVIVPNNNYKEQPIEKPYEKYTIENLSKTNIPTGTIFIQKELSKKENYTSYLFNHAFDPTFSGQKGKNVTGQINIPKGEGKFPLVLMIRGYVDENLYQTGMGTKNGAAYFANNGFITVAPDFLGYGGSDNEAGNIFESRFQTYTTVLSVLHSLASIKQWDGKNIFIWAHSNGGQIAFTTLAITGADYPTVLWAPVSKPFPYSILYFTDDSEDKGKFLRNELADFEKLYDVNLYSFDNYLDRIQAPLILHQGTADTAVPLSWSNSIVSLLKSKDKDISYYTYNGVDHNLQPSWNAVISADLSFYQKHMK
jgi:dipeptidyl aminopeptidase/acylaminoacyl peptidase